MQTGFSFQDAVFVAALPYRKSVYASGGFAQTAGPMSAKPLWNRFLRAHFASRQLERARNQAALYDGAAHAFLDSPELERRCGSARIRFVSIWDTRYPEALRACYDPPPVLFYLECASGNLDTSTGAIPGAFAGLCGSGAPEALAIVGTRHAHPFAGEAVQAYIQEIAAARLPVGQVPAAGSARRGPRVNQARPLSAIVSGFARGIDRRAHEAAIDCGLPGVAVLGAGLLHAGPAMNLDLPDRARAKAAPFAFVSEFPPHAPARAAHFPRRNRIIAGLVQRVAVLQAPLKSGAMITARFALDEGRDVLAFDHEVLRAAGAGNDGGRQLLESGATPIHLPGLEERLHRAPPFTRAARAARLALWKRAALADDLRWLGGRYYLSAS